MRSKNKKERKSRKKINLNTLVDLITILDGYRINRCVELKSADKAIKKGELGWRLLGEWKAIRRGLIKMASFPASLSKVTKLKKIQILINFSGVLALVAAFILIMFPSPKTSTYAYGFLIAFVFVALIATRILARFLTRRIAIEVDEFYRKHPKKFSALRLRLKTIVQDLIDDLSDLIKRSKYDPSDYAIGLYNIDYRGLKITKKPGRFRKYYIAEVDIGFKGHVKKGGFISKVKACMHANKPCVGKQLTEKASFKSIIKLLNSSF